MAGEQFGTNLRATAATTTPNVVRGTVPLFGLVVREWLKPLIGFGPAVMVGAAVVMAVALVALTQLQETYGKPLDYVDA
jgi:MFS transporter, putative metabolite:H+ symporter